jgi:hypothetical protein
MLGRGGAILRNVLPVAEKVLLGNGSFAEAHHFALSF